MLLYSKIKKPKTKECEVINQVEAKNLGWEQNNVEFAYDGKFYLEGYAPVKPAPTHDEVSEMRKQYRRDNIDDKTAERSRKQANGSWTAEDEQEYLDLDEEVTAYIEEHFPYND